MYMSANLLRRYKLIIFYGLALALLLFVLKWLEWRFIIFDHALELYSGALAVLFTALGIWLALKLARPKVETRVVEKEVIVTREIAVPATSVEGTAVVGHSAATYAAGIALAKDRVAAALGKDPAATALGKDPAAALGKNPGAAALEKDPGAAEAALARLGISQRELEVLQLMAEGLSNQEIAGRLFVSLNTIKTHSQRLFEKLDVRRRTQAVETGRKLQIIA